MNDHTTIDLSPPPGVTSSTWAKVLGFVAEQALSGQYFWPTFHRAQRRWPSIGHDHAVPIVGSRDKLGVFFELLGGVWSEWSDVDDKS